MLGVRGRLCVAALACALPAGADVLKVRLASGEVLAEWPMEEGHEVCLTWFHSVTGGDVADCFVNDAGRLVLMRSYLHDFAAGLGESPGRGTLSPAPGGGYWIEGIGEVMPGNALALRIGGAAVDHRLALDGKSLALSVLAPGQAARLFLNTDRVE